MKLLVIIFVFVGGVGFCGYKTYKYFDDKKVAGQKAMEEGLQRQKEREEAAKQEAALKPQPVPVDVLPPMNTQFANMGMKGAGGLEQTTIGNYVFKNRIAPDSPTFLRTDNFRLLVEKDVESNSWVWMGSTVLAAQISDLAAAYDRRQMEMDLEFCLVLMNTDKIRSAGLSVLYNPGASWLSALQLTPDAGSLRLSLDDWAINLDYQKTDAAATIIQVPVIRVLDGQPWQFSTDSEVPVPKSDISEGVIRQSLEYVKTGFGLSGVVRMTGDQMILTVDQRNGAIAPADNSTPQSQYPQFTVQSLKTSLRLSLQEWSVLGGMQIDKTELRKGLLGKKIIESSDYLVIFVRPRGSLDAPPRAVPVPEFGEDDSSHLLLPPRTRAAGVWPDGVPVMQGVLPLPVK